MLGYVFVIIKNSKYHFGKEDIEEIASDVFLTLWKNQDKLDINKEMASYIAGVTKNLVLKKQRNIKNKHINIDSLEYSLYDNTNLHHQTEETEKSSIVLEELMKMKAEDRNIFTSYYYYSKGIKEISKMLNIPENKVKSRLFRIRRKMKKELEKRGYSYGS